jgi:O-antigen ligase
MFALIALGLLRRFLDRAEDILSRPADLLIVGVAALCGIVGMAACALTGSRTSLAGLVLLSLFVALWRNRARGSILVLLAAAVVGAAFGGMTTLVRYQNLAHDLPSRQAMWRITLDSALAHPGFGIGLGGFERMKEAALTPSNATALWSLGSAHQALLQATAEGGIPFAALLIAALVLAVAPAWRVIFGQGPVQGVALGTAAAAALAISCSMFGIELNVPAVAVMTLFLLGATAGQARPRRARAPAHREAVEPAPESQSDATLVIKAHSNGHGRNLFGRSALEGHVDG